MKRSLRILALLTFLWGAAWLAVACARAPSPSTVAPLELTDGLGRTVHLDAPAQRVVSLAPSNTEILFALGAGAQVVGRDSFSDYPAEAKALADVGGSFGQWNVEVILTLQPDLVLASDLNTPEQVQALEKAGLKVFLLSNPKDFPGLYQNLRLVAKLVGHEAEAETLITQLEQRLSAVQSKTAAATKRPLVFYELDASTPNAPWTSGGGTFIDHLIRMAGGENLGAALQGEWVQISLEELIARQPDIILLGDAVWGGVTVEAVQARPGWGALQAVQQGRVYPFDDNLVSRPGPRLVDGLEAMARLFHPQLFP